MLLRAAEGHQQQVQHHLPRLVLSILVSCCCLAAFTLSLHLQFAQYLGLPGVPDSYNAGAARLDDPLHFRQYWLLQQGYQNISIDEVRHIQKDKIRTGRKHKTAGQLAPGVVCDNSCFKARDGVCDEGRKGNITAANRVNWVSCDLGTDCHDCGPWQGAQHGPAWTEAVPPISYLRMHGIEDVRVRRVPYAPAFFFAYTSPDSDTDQSAQMTADGVVEPGMTQVAHAVLSRRCNPSSPGSSGLVVDVGANFGWYSLLAAALGCSVVSFEPVPIFRAFLEYSAARNHLTSFMEVIPALVADDVERSYTVNVPLSGPWGQSGMYVQHMHNRLQVPAKAVRLDDLAYPLSPTPQGSSSSSSRPGTVSQTLRHLLQQQRQSQSIPGSTAAAHIDGTPMSTTGILDEFLTHVQHHQQQQERKQLASRYLSSGRPVDLLKVDVEGQEPEVFRSAERLMSSGRVRHVLMEYSPGYFYNRLDKMEQLPQLLLSLIAANYTLAHLPWHMVLDASAVADYGSWNMTSKSVDDITQQMLRYDIWTAQKLRDGTLPGMQGPSSWPCPEMAESGITHSPDLSTQPDYHVLYHPKSFAAQFPVNTNIWASKDGQLQAPAGHKRGLFPDTYRSSKQWFPEVLAGNATQSDVHHGAHDDHGLPWVFCDDVAAEYQVAYRCRCRDWDVCGHQQLAVQTCEDKGITGYEDLEGL